MLQITASSAGTTHPARQLTAAAEPQPSGTAFGCARNFLNNRFIYAVISPRARGLSIGVNFNPDRYCNFDCIYCEVDRQRPAENSALDIEAMAAELRQTLAGVVSGKIRSHPGLAAVSADLLQLRHVTLSGDGEPTLCERFVEAVEAVIHVRALAELPFFKIVLVTNGAGLDRPEVETGLKYFTGQDEVWIKLDAGTQAFMEKINRPRVPLERILANILRLGLQREIVIQTLLAEVGGELPPLAEIDEYSARLLELKNRGARIQLVQIYSANRPTPHQECKHLALAELSRFAQRVRQSTGLKVEVY